jgi:[ribosomal protein S18]-alanine N-acetyltransferase
MGSRARSHPGRLIRVKLRAATLDDLRAVSALEQVCYADPWPDSAFQALPGNPQVFFQVAEGADGEITGYVVAWYVLDEGELANLAVAAARRRSGLGKVLLDAMLTDARRRSISEVYLEVRESNVAARQLYAANHFVEVGRRRGYYRSPVEDALILRRTLKP